MCLFDESSLALLVRVFATSVHHLQIGQSRDVRIQVGAALLLLCVALSCYPCSLLYSLGSKRDTLTRLCVGLRSRTRQLQAPLLFALHTFRSNHKLRALRFLTAGPTVIPPGLLLNAPYCEYGLKQDVANRIAIISASPATIAPAIILLQSSGWGKTALMLQLLLSYRGVYLCWEQHPGIGMPPPTPACDWILRRLRYAG